MLKRLPISAALAVGAAVWLAAGCKPPPPPAPIAPSNPVVQTGRPPADTGTPSDMADTTPVRDAVDSALKQNSALFPKGAKLQSVAVQGGVATLDFSAEFNKLANMGDSTESGAQKRLRAALAQFPAIEKMCVTVAGKPFDSQVTDWTTPFAVRDAAEGKGESPSGAGVPRGGG